MSKQVQLLVLCLLFSKDNGWRLFLAPCNGNGNGTEYLGSSLLRQSHRCE